MAAEFASLVLTATIYIFPERHSMVFYGDGVWQCIMAFALSDMLKKRDILGGDVVGGVM